MQATFFPSLDEPANHFFFFFLMIRRPPRSTLFPTRRSSDLIHAGAGRADHGQQPHAAGLGIGRGPLGRIPFDAAQPAPDTTSRGTGSRRCAASIGTGAYRCACAVAFEGGTCRCPPMNSDYWATPHYPTHYSHLDS